MGNNVCRVRFCDNKPIKGTKYCEKHTCGMCNDGYGFPFNKNIRYNEHYKKYLCQICSVKWFCIGCHNLKEPSEFMFCNDCKCTHKDCPFPKINGFEYCKYDICKLKSCNNIINNVHTAEKNIYIIKKPKRKYCEKHKCKNCNNLKQKSLKICYECCCENDTCLNEKVKGEKYCIFHSA